MIPKLRMRFNQEFAPASYQNLLRLLRERCHTEIEFRVAETPVFLERAVLEDMANAGAILAKELISNREYLVSALAAIPSAYRVSGDLNHPNFLTADFALTRNTENGLIPRLVEIQAFPSVYGYQAILNETYRQAYGLDPKLGVFLSGLDEDRYWTLLSRTILGRFDPEDVVLTEIDPLHQKTRPDFEVMTRRLGIAVVDITTLECEGDRLFYRSHSGQRMLIRRIYNRAIADELISKEIRLPVDLTKHWDVEWAGHPNWYFLISKFSIPWLTRLGIGKEVVPPAVFLKDFLERDGRSRLAQAGVELPSADGLDTIYNTLLLKPLFSFAGKGIRFDPTQRDLLAIPPACRGEYLLQERMQFVPTIETPFGLTQAEIRILYLWPDDGSLTPVLPLVRLGRGKMMGVDHNRNQEWVGASASFFPPD